jgi:hypothetical protein
MAKKNQKNHRTFGKADLLYSLQLSGSCGTPVGRPFGLVLAAQGASAHSANLFSSSAGDNRKRGKGLTIGANCLCLYLDRAQLAAREKQKFFKTKIIARRRVGAHEIKAARPRAWLLP